MGFLNEEDRAELILALAEENAKAGLVRRILASLGRYGEKAKGAVGSAYGRVAKRFRKTPKFLPAGESPRWAKGADFSGAGRGLIMRGGKKRGRLGRYLTKRNTMIAGGTAAGLAAAGYGYKRSRRNKEE